MPRAHQKRTIEYKAVGLLLLDPENPRLTNHVGADQDSLLSWMIREEAIDELGLSLAEHGFFSEEPLVIVPDPKTGKFIVVEGNRRIAAVKVLLMDEAERAKVGAVGWPILSKERKEDLKEVPTVEYGDRNEVVPYLGFRHITGVKTWDPYAKAKYVAQLIDSGRKVQDIEQGIGDSAGAVRKLYQSLIVYNQAVKELGFPPADLRARYSLLELVLSQQPVKKFLGLPRELPQAKMERVIPEDRLPRLGELLSWVFGNSKTGALPVIKDSRQITQRLGPVIGDADAVSYLQEHRDLEGAYERSGGEREFLLKQLRTAGRYAERANGVAPNHSGDAEAHGDALRLKKTVDAVEKTLA